MWGLLKGGGEAGLTGGDVGDGVGGGCGVVGKVEKARVWYDLTMVKKQVKEVLDRVLTWPAERQEDATRVLTEMEEYDASSLRLTDEQLAEVQRRRAKKNPKYVSLADARKRFQNLDV